MSSGDAALFRFGGLPVKVVITDMQFAVGTELRSGPHPPLKGCTQAIWD
jgi:hypothetical protein